jgi:hypothetical protein
MIQLVHSVNRCEGRRKSARVSEGLQGLYRAREGPRESVRARGSASRRSCAACIRMCVMRVGDEWLLRFDWVVCRSVCARESAS